MKNDHIVRVIDATSRPSSTARSSSSWSCSRDEYRNPCGHDAAVRSRCLRVARASGLRIKAAHAVGMIHRDLKPGNLFLVENPRSEPLVKVVDFGIAKVRETAELSGDAGQGDARTASGAVVGTPLYMAPEQATGNTTAIGVRTDVWSMGMIAFRLLTGVDYWEGANVAAILGQIAYAPIRLRRREIASSEPPSIAGFRVRARARRTSDTRPSENRPSRSQTRFAFRFRIPSGASSLR